jgi:uncharacterized coiled-coil DUF342 family protein
MKKAEKLTKQQKIKQLHTKRDEAIEKLNKLYIGFHGVRHESASSEMRYAQIMVMEDYIRSLEAELKTLETTKSFGSH